MPTPFRTPLRPLVTCLCAAALSAQGPPSDTATPREEPHFVVRRYPEDHNAAIAVVGQRTLTLGDLVDRIDVRHYPGFKKLLAEQPTFQAYLRSDLIAPWVRQLADLEALQQSLGDTYVDPVALEQAQSASLKGSFERWLGTYVENLRAQGRPTELTQARVDRLLADFQLKHGLAAELQGMLDHLEPDDYTRKELRDFFNANARYFGGQVTIAHILVQHRDAGTGILLKDEGIARANAKLADVRARLRPDGSNFEELARLFSDDVKTGRDGGVLHGVHRFDDRLPAALCREAWRLRDGEVSDEVVETQYGWHLVKRLDFAQQIFILFTDDAIPSIRLVMRRAMQEERLFGARERAGVRLLM